MLRETVKHRRCTQALAIRQFQRRDLCPTTIATSVGLSRSSCGRQIHQPLVICTRNSEPTNTDNQSTTSGRALPRTAAPGCVLWRANTKLEPGNHCIPFGKLLVGRVVDCNLSSNFYFLFFNRLQWNLAERVGFEPTEQGYCSLDFESSSFD